MSINPLSDILRLLAEPRTYRMEEITEVVGMPPALVRQMIADLQRLGYLKNAANTSPGCAGCGKRCTAAGKILELTNRGKVFLRSAGVAGVFF